MESNSRTGSLVCRLASSPVIRTDQWKSYASIQVEPGRLGPLTAFATSSSALLVRARKRRKRSGVTAKPRFVSGSPRFRGASNRGDRNVAGKSTRSVTESCLPLQPLNVSIKIDDPTRERHPRRPSIRSKSRTPRIPFPSVRASSWYCYPATVPQSPSCRSSKYLSASA